MRIKSLNYNMKIERYLLKIESEKYYLAVHFQSDNFVYFGFSLVALLINLIGGNISFTSKIFYYVKFDAYSYIVDLNYRRLHDIIENKRKPINILQAYNMDDYATDYVVIYDDIAISFSSKNDINKDRLIDDASYILSYLSMNNPFIPMNLNYDKIIVSYKFDTIVNDHDYHFEIITNYDIIYRFVKRI